MPHLSVEATPFLAERIDWPALFGKIHHRLDAEHAAKLGDFKSRLLVVGAYLAGNSPDEEFVVVRFITTVPRPDELRRHMASVVQDMVREAVAAVAGDRRWQACVLSEPFAPEDYFKTVSPRDDYDLSRR